MQFNLTVTLYTTCNVHVICLEAQCQSCNHQNKSCWMLERNLLWTKAQNEKLYFTFDVEFQIKLSICLVNILPPFTVFDNCIRIKSVSVSSKQIKVKLSVCSLGCQTGFSKNTDFFLANILTGEINTQQSVNSLWVCMAMCG